MSSQGTTQAQPSLAQQQSFYDQRWRQFQYADRVRLARCVEILERIHRLRLERPVIIDAGCGAGWLTGILAVFGPAVGVDLSPEAIRLARERWPAATFFCADFIRWNYPEESADVIVSQEVLEHVAEPRAYLKRASDLLRHGGYLILTTPNARVTKALSSPPAQPIENHFDRRRLERLVGSFFTVVELTTIIPGYGHREIYRLVNSIRLRRLENRLRLAGLLDRLRCRLGFGLHLLCVARKL